MAMAIRPFLQTVWVSEFGEILVAVSVNRTVLPMLLHLSGFLVQQSEILKHGVLSAIAH